MDHVLVSTSGSLKRITRDNLDFLRSDADDSFGGTLMGVSDGTNPTIGFRGGGPNFIRFYDTLDASDNVNAVDIKYRRTPNDLLIERASNSNIIAEFGGDDGHAALYFDNSKKLETNVYGTTITGTINADSSTLTNLTLDAGATINEFSTDGTLGGNSDTAVPTENAVKTYVTNNAGG